MNEEAPDRAVGFEESCPFENHVHSNVCHPTGRAVSTPIRFRGTSKRLSHFKGPGNLRIPNHACCECRRVCVNRRLVTGEPDNDGRFLG
jgi:hypothetical protein